MGMPGNTPWAWRLSVLELDASNENCAAIEPSSSCANSRGAFCSCCLAALL
jgi:hypothetical protein